MHNLRFDTISHRLFIAVAFSPDWKMADPESVSPPPPSLVLQDHGVQYTAAAANEQLVSSLCLFPSGRQMTWRKQRALSSSSSSTQTPQRSSSPKGYMSPTFPSASEIPTWGKCLGWVPSRKTPLFPLLALLRKFSDRTHAEGRPRPLSPALFGIQSHSENPVKWSFFFSKMYPNRCF